MRLTGLALLGVVSLASVAHASPVNLVANGSFENGSGSAGAGGSFAGWTIGNAPYGSGPGAGPERITYGPNATGYGDTVSPDPFTFSPDPSGAHAAFFVDDGARESLSQSISITGGVTYEVGFDFFETPSGAGNPNPFSLSAALNGTVLKTISSSDPAFAPGTWNHIYQVFTATTPGTSGFTFSYLSGGGGGNFAKDVMVDDVYVELAPASDVPEPASLTLLGVGIAALTFLGFRLHRAG